MTATRLRSADSTTRHVATCGGTARLAAGIATTTILAVLIVAAAVRVALAARVRRWLGYTFPGLPPRTDIATGIFAHNGRAILGTFGLLLIAQMSARASGTPNNAQRLIRTVGEVILAGAIAANTLIVGAALGAYGQRMTRALLPHGPVELAAYATALALYLQGRTRPLPAAHMAKVAAASVALLALAALLETFVSA